MTHQRDRVSKLLPPSDRHFLVPFGVCATSLVAALLVGPEWVALLLIGTQTSLLVGCAALLLWQQQDAESRSSLLDGPFQLARNGELFDHYQRLTQSLLDISRVPDPIYRNLARQRLTSMADDAAQIAGKTIVFQGTETWRIVYDQLLRSTGIHQYRSVAWAKNRHYWLDEPGRKSLQTNYELHANGQLQIERIVILADELWPVDSPLPVDLMRQWIHEQHHQGLVVRLVRESALVNESDLIADIGLYGSRALGIQELDAECRTTRFTLTFDFDQLAAAEARWKRLNVYAAPYASLLNDFWLADDESHDD